MKFSIRTLLTVPLLCLTLTPVGIVSWLFYSNSQEAVEEIATDLLDQVSDRTYEQIQLYLATPHFINQLNANAMELGLLDLRDRNAMERYFVHQFRAAYQTGRASGEAEPNSEFTRSINHIYIGTAGGAFSGAEYRPVDRSDPDSETIVAISRFEDTHIFQYRPGPDGSATERLDPEEIKQGPRYEPFKRPWYQKGLQLLETGQDAAWSVPYCDSSTQRPAVTAVRPVQLNGEFLGILGSDFLFSDIEQFLKSLVDGLKMGGGTIFILSENQEVLINSSVGQQESCNSGGAGQLSLPLASQLDNVIISRLVNAPVSPDGLNRIEFNGVSYFWDSLDFQDAFGLQLSIFIVIPEASFKGSITASTNYTVFLCGLTVLITGLLGLVIARRITQPVMQLEAAVKGLVTSINQERALDIHIQNPSELHTLSHAFSAMSEQLRDAFQAFSHFVPQNFLNSLGCKDATEVQLGQYKTAEMTILFADIRSFTRLSETLGPQKNFEFINSYLRCMEPAITENHGFIDKYIGDAIMALFEGPHSADHAVKAGLAMLQRLGTYNQIHRQGQSPLKIGIGIHTGNIILGTIGGQKRWETTVIGGDVNRASRLEGLTKEFGVNLLVSHQTLDRIRQSYHYRYLGKSKVRGLDRLIRTYEIYEADAPPVFADKQKNQEVFAKALWLYEQGEYHQALGLFQQVLAGGHDRVAEFYSHRCQLNLGNACRYR